MLRDDAVDCVKLSTDAGRRIRIGWYVDGLRKTLTILPTGRRAVGGVSVSDGLGERRLDFHQVHWPAA